MPKRQASRPRPSREPATDRRRTSPGLLDQRSLETGTAPLPTVRLRSVKRHPFLYRKLIDRVEGNAGPGDLVAVYTPQSELLGYGLYNPRAEIQVRMLQFGDRLPGREFWQQKLDAAVGLRRDMLQLDRATDTYRLIHAEADGFPGLVIDRYGDVLSAEVFSLGAYQRINALLELLAPLVGTAHTLIQVPAQSHGQEGFLADPSQSPELPAHVVVQEFGTRFQVNFKSGHKTGFFCDQRDNRRRLAEFCPGKSVLDLCCYTGGFAIQAQRLGQAADVTAVDLDEEAIAVARANARLNDCRPQFVHADAFGYMRDMIQNGRQYDVVVLDPPKLIRNRREFDAGQRKYFDMNRLALQLVRPGGLLLSCSCSGLLSADEFLRTIGSAAREAGPPLSGLPGRHGGRTVQILDRTGAGPDHPIAMNCPETEYLKADWLRVTD